jgi:transcriptional regulator with XRE-family HTH domain
MKLSKLRTSGLAATRTRLGLSQQQLAEQLGVSKATISMAETGRRKLPTAALIRLAQLEIKMATAKTEERSGAVIIASDEMPSPMQCHALEIREMQVRKLSGTLENMQLQFNRLHTQLQLIDAMLVKETNPHQNFFALCMQINRERLGRQLSKYGATQQTLLLNKIALLNAEAHLNKSVRQQLV